MNRRNLLISTAVLAFAACTMPARTPQDILDQTKLVITSLDTMVRQIQASQPKWIPADLLTKIETYVAQGEVAASQLINGLPAAEGAAVINTVEGYINDVLGVLAGPPMNGNLPAPYNTIVAAIVGVLPAIEVFVNQYIPTSAPPAAHKFSVKAPNRAQAVDTLKKYVGK